MTHTPSLSSHREKGDGLLIEPKSYRRKETTSEKDGI